jgi:transposase
MDNLSVHKTNEVRACCQKHDVTEIFNVPYSPEFNGIECFFSIVKNEYKKTLLSLLVLEEELD